MDQAIADTAPIESIKPDDLQSRRTNTLYLWLACDWFWLVLSTAIVTANLSNWRKAGHLGSMSVSEFAVWALGIFLSIIWMISIVYAFQNRQWAIRIGALLSVFGFGAFLAFPVSALVAALIQHEYLAVIACMIGNVLLLAAWRDSQWNSNPTHRLWYYTTTAACVMVLLWRSFAAEIPQVVSNAISSSWIMSYSMSLVLPHLLSYRVMLGGDVQTNPTGRQRFAQRALDDDGLTQA